MVLVRQAVPDGHAGVFGQLLNDGLAVAAVLDALKHAGQHLRGIRDGLFLADLAARWVQIGRAHAKVVRGDLERAAGAGGGFLKDQRHILAAQRVVRNARPFLGLQLGCQIQQITDFRGGKVQQRQKIMPYEVHSKAPFKYTVYLYKYTYIIARLGMICKCGFLWYN